MPHYHYKTTENHPLPDVSQMMSMMEHGMFHVSMLDTL